MSRRGRNEGSISQRGDGRWMARMSLPGGRRKYFYGDTRREVARKLNTAQRDRDLGLPIPAERQTVAQYLHQWLEDAVKNSLRPRTFECYDLCVRRLVGYLGHHRLASLTPEHIQNTYTTLLDTGLSRRSVELTHAVLHRALKQALRWRLIGYNPADAVVAPHPKRREMKTLTDEQVQVLFASSVDDRLHVGYVLLVTTGLRLGEALGLKWEDIDFDTGRLTVKRALQRQKDRGLVLVEPKTDRSRRTVHLAKGTVAKLSEHRYRQLKERLAAGALWQDTGLVFSTVTGGPIDAKTVNDSFRKALTQAGLPIIRVHDLRHTAATLLLSQGTHPKVVQDFLGHSTIALTMDTYSHVMAPLRGEVAERMDGLFEPQKKSA